MLQSFLLAGFLQGLLIALFFLFHKTEVNKKAHRVLGVFLLAVSINMLAAAGFTSGNMAGYPYLIRVAELLPFLYPPLILFYTYYILYPEERFFQGYLLLFLPLVAGLIVLFPFYLKPAAEKVEIYSAMLKGNYPFSFYLLFIAKSLYGIIVLVICFLKVQRAEKLVRYIYSETRGREISWLKYLLLAFFFMWLMATLRFMIGYKINSVYVPGILLTALIYLLSYFTLKQKQLFSHSDVELLNQIDGSGDQAPDNSFTPAENRPVQKDIPEETGSRNRIENAEKIFDHVLNTSVSQKVYLNKELTLQQLAGLCGVRPNILSAVLNDYYQKNFYDFVNELRAKEAVTRLQDNAFSHLTIEALAEECGFKSKSTFYQSFKKLTGQTPTQYKKGLVG